MRIRADGTWQAPDGSHPAALTLGDLHAAVEVYASWFHAQGVKPRDIVAVQTRSSTEFARYRHRIWELLHDEVSRAQQQEKEVAAV